MFSRPTHRGMSRINTLCLLAGALVLAGCAHRPTAPGDVRIAIRETNVELMRQVEWIGFRITAVIVNDGDSDLFLAPCATHVQMERSDGWRDVWAPICVSMDGPSRRIAPRDSSREAIAVQWSTAAAGPGRFPFSAVTAGRYRVVFSIGRHVNEAGVLDRQLSESVRTSAPIVVRERGTP